jgi:DNA-directed RNA polymerase subunit B
MADPSTKRWPVIQDILKREGIARMHLKSFDEFLERGLQSIINEVGQIDIENAEYPYKIQLGKVKLQQPRMMELDGSITHITPAEARLRNVSYSAPVMMEASVVEDGKILESRFVHIGDIPVMAKSMSCQEKENEIIPCQKVINKRRNRNRKAKEKTIGKKGIRKMKKELEKKVEMRDR